MASGSLVGLRHRVQKEFRSLLLVEMKCTTSAGVVSRTHMQRRFRVLNTKSALVLACIPWFDGVAHSDGVCDP